MIQNSKYFQDQEVINQKNLATLLNTQSIKDIEKRQIIQVRDHNLILLEIFVILKALYFLRLEEIASISFRYLYDIWLILGTRRI